MINEPASDTASGNESRGGVELRDEVRRLERLLLEQEHRLWPAIRNFFSLRERRAEAKEDKARYEAARLALIRRLFFGPEVIGVAVGGVGVAGIVVAVWTATLFQEQNAYFKKQNQLFKEQNSSLLEQFESESKDRNIARRAELLGTIYKCRVESAASTAANDERYTVVGDCAGPRARKEAVEAFAVLDSGAAQPVILSNSYLFQTEANLSGRDLAGSAFHTAIIDGLDFHGANLEDAVFTNALARRVDMRMARLINANLCSANLFAADLREAKLMGAKLSRVDLRSAKLDNADLRSASISGDLRHAKFLKADMRGAVFSGVIEDATFIGTDLTNADFSLTTIVSSKFMKATLIGADFSRANLGGGRLSFAAANVTNADFSGADLSGVVLSQEQLDTAEGDSATVLPKDRNLHRPDHWDPGFFVKTYEVDPPRVPLCTKLYRWDGVGRVGEDFSFDQYRPRNSPSPLMQLWKTEPR